VNNVRFSAEGSKRKRRGISNDEQDNPGIKAPPPLIYLLPLLLGLILDRRAHVPFLPRGVACVLGWPLAGGAMALAAWFARTMRRANTTMHVNKPVSRVVQDGPFRYSRNPGYLSLLMIYMGIAILRNALWVILLLPLLVVVTKRELIEREERYLERTFGEEYLAYKRRVRRWV
jgi:protein-S-isoprenylcysteine O-methyltransferase Ste14